VGISVGGSGVNHTSKMLYWAGQTKPEGERGSTGPTNLKLCGCRTKGLPDFHSPPRIESWPPNSCQWCKQTKCSGRDFKKHFTKANRRSCWMMGVGWQKGACQFAGGNYEPCVCICVVTGAEP